MPRSPFLIGKMLLSPNVIAVMKNHDAAASLQPDDLVIAGELKQS
jgi:hypothetical protein